MQIIENNNKNNTIDHKSDEFLMLLILNKMMDLSDINLQNLIQVEILVIKIYPYFQFKLKILFRYLYQFCTNIPMSEKRFSSQTNNSKSNSSDKIIDFSNYSPSMSFIPNSNSNEWLDYFSFLNNMITQNNKLFETVNQTSDILTHNVECLQSLGAHQDQNENNIPKIKLNKISKYSQKLQNQLFGIKQYKYQLVLNPNIPTQFYKGKNLKIQVNLVDTSGTLIINSNPIPISLVAYDSNQKPQIILKNKKNQSIFNGNCESELKKGYGIFEKIQFREVTSVYRQRWIYFVIYPKIASINYQQSSTEKVTFIDYNDIKPLILSEIVIKSKKI